MGNDVVVGTSAVVVGASMVVGVAVVAPSVVDDDVVPPGRAGPGMTMVVGRRPR